VPFGRLASHEEEDRSDEEGQSAGSVGRWVRGDEEPRKCEQDWNSEGCAGFEVEGNTGRNGGDF
jgi:hypothetical protein